MDENNLHINIQEISREELIKTFEVLCNKGLINQSELQRAIFLASQRYKQINQLLNQSNI